MIGTDSEYIGIITRRIQPNILLSCRVAHLGLCRKGVGLLSVMSQGEVGEAVGSDASMDWAPISLTISPKFI